MKDKSSLELVLQEIKITEGIINQARREIDEYQRKIDINQGVIFRLTDVKDGLSKIEQAIRNEV